MDYFNDLIARHRNTAELAEPVTSHFYTGETPSMTANRRDTEFLVNDDRMPLLLAEAFQASRGTGAKE